MSRLARFCPVGALASLLAVSPGLGLAEPQAERQPPPAREPARRPSPEPDSQARPRTPPPEREPARPPDRGRDRVVVRGEVFVGGYFYDPIWGPYPWWPRGRYPIWYAPVYDVRATLRVKATPKDAAVYVDGFYAGSVDDFDGVFQGLPLPPGGHVVTLYRPGLRSQRHNLYLRSGSTFTLRAMLQPLAPGERPELPPAAGRVPPPPRPESYRLPVPRWPEAESTSDDDRAGPTGWLDLRVQPRGAVVTIDGERWFTSDPGRLVADLPAGRHQLRVTAPGYVAADVEVTVGDGERQAITVSLVPAT